MRCALLAVVGWILLGLSATAPADGEPAPPKQEREDPYPEEFRLRVNQAVDRGVEYLLGKQLPNGAWEAKTDPADGANLSDHRMGVNALCLLACLKGGVPSRDPAIERAFGYLRPTKIDRTYDAGVLLMALHARYTGGKDDVAGERDRYGFDAAAGEEPCTKSMTREDRALMERAVKFLLDNRDAGHWGYPQKRWDLSNTQYALLGLWAASRCGVKVPAEVWIEILETVLTDQERTGPATKLQANEVRGEYRVVWTEDARARGFRYRPEDPVTGSMTTAGLACVAICQDELWTSRRFTPEHRTRVRKSVRDALAWLQDNFDVAKNPGLPGGGWHLYYLYGLERAGILTRSRFVGRFDWYLEGATWLLGHPSSNGSWAVEHPLLDTAFAVLFLRRSTQRARNPAITPSEPGPVDGGKR